MTTIAKVLLAGPDMKHLFRALRAGNSSNVTTPTKNQPQHGAINWPENRMIRPVGRQPNDPHGLYGPGDWEDPLLLEFRRKW